MKIGILFYDMQEFGGLEEIAVTLAIELQHHGHQVSVISTGWVNPNNQYSRRLQEYKVPLVQLPKWISQPASNWYAKEAILAKIMRLLTPLVYLLAILLQLAKRQSWAKSRESAHNWVQGQLMNRVIGPDRREPLMRLLLSWWRLRWRPDILHIHGYTNTTLFAVDWAHAKNIPVVYEEHQTPDAQFNWWQGFDNTINKAAMVVAVSEKSADALRDICGVTQPITVMGPIVADPAASGWQLEFTPKTQDEPIHVTTVARLFVTKGLNYLLEAIVQVKAVYPNTEFKVYGDGVLRQELLDQAAQLGLNGQEIFVGAFTDRRELANIMAQTDMFVMSSILEGQPLTIVEAMSYGCPIVTTAVGGIPELIKEGTNGLLCQPKDPDCLAQKILTLIENPALRTKLGSAARKSYEQGPFQPASVCQYFISIYDKVLQQEGRNSAAGFSYST
ncbi:MAG TPA: glycosyltransferase family 4 protein [Anaerolineae bacterium]|nr:glycosyltransferase family 4 protein [Anaerolineae bacterium]